MIQDIDKINRVNKYLRRFRTQTKINQNVLINYIRQYYIHSAQDVRCQTLQYL